MKNSNQIHVLMPNDTILEVSYYCEAAKTINKNKAHLIIQLDDCICKMEIEQSICHNEALLEQLVHNKVINTKGHLC